MDFGTTSVLVLLTLILCLPLFKNMKSKKKIQKYIDIFPGDKCYPIIGTMWKRISSSKEELWDFLKHRHTTLGPIYRSWNGSLPVVHIYKPDHAQVIFKSNTTLSKGQVYKFVRPWLGDGLISSSDIIKWRHHRKVITPAFHFKALDTYSEVFSEKSQSLVNFLDQFDGQGYIEITEYLSRVTLDIISETAMGVKINFLENPNSDYAKAILQVIKIVMKRINNPLIGLGNELLFKRTKMGKDMQQALNIIFKFNKDVIRKRKELLLKQNMEVKTEDEDTLGIKQKISFLDILLKHQEKDNLDDSEILEEVNTFMFGGHDTTTTLTTNALLALGNHSEILKNVHAELDEIFEGDRERPIVNDDLCKMKYLDRVINEVLRCYCMIPTIGRYLEEDIELDGHTIPKGVTVLISLYDMLHDPEQYPDPFKFDPDRFLPENSVKRHPYAFSPFSAGRRNCIGQKFGLRNVKTLLAGILRKYDLKCQEHPDTIKYYYEITLRPQNGLHVALERRR